MRHIRIAGLCAAFATLLSLSGCDLFSFLGDQSNAGKNFEASLAPSPDRARLVCTTFPDGSLRLAFGIGIPIPCNQWTPWELGAGETARFCVYLESGKTYTIRWDDKKQGSTTTVGGLAKPNYTGDVQIAKFTDMNNQPLILTGDMDNGYATGRSYIPLKSQFVLITIKIKDDNPANVGSFALLVSDAAGSTGAGSSDFQWYLDGQPVPGATSYLYLPSMSAIGVGPHRVAVTGKREGFGFSEEYRFDKN